MKIAFLHLTLGLVDRGSEVVTDLVASTLARKHQVLVLQAGPLTNKPYEVSRPYTLTSAPIAAPRSLIDKLLFRLHLNSGAQHVRRFTTAAIPHLRLFAPDLIVCINGASQIKILQQSHLPAKIVVFGHAGIGHDDYHTLKAGPDLFIALTPQAKLWADTIVSPTTKVVHIPNPLSINRPKPVSLGLPHPIVLCVGALTYYKNIPSVINAVGQLNASLLLIGDGEAASQVQSALSHFTGDFRWLRHVDPAEIANYYASSDIFCFLPDRQEAFGRVYLEAMVAGLPIVASDDPIRLSIVGEQGVYADPHNPDSIIRALQIASTKGRLNYTKELKPYQLKTVVSQIEKEFHALIK